MGGSASKGDRDQTVQADPRVYAAYDRAMGQAGSLLNAPSTPGFYPGDTVAGMNNRQEQALGDAYRRGIDGSAQEAGLDQYISGQLGQDYAGQIQDTAGQLTGALGTAQNALGGMAQGGMSLDQASQFAGQGSSAYDAALQQQASGAINPMTSQMYQAAAQNLGESFQESVLPGINATFGSAGRTGSGLQADALGNAAGELADAQGELAANMFGQASEGALQRQLAAAQGGLGSSLAQQQLAGQLYGQDANRALQAAGQLQGGALGGMGGLQGLAGLQQGAAGMTGMSSALDWQNLDQARGVGDAYQSQRQAEIDADRERYEHESSRGIQDWERHMRGLQSYLGLTAPLSGSGTTESDSSMWSKFT